MSGPPGGRRVIVGVPGEAAPDERRVAITPPVAGELIEDGHEVLVVAGAGSGADWPDASYEAVGCRLEDDREAVIADADVIVHVRALGAVDDSQPVAYGSGQIVVGLLGPYALDRATLERLADREVSTLALELLPRTGRAQRMDVLSSMASIAGYKAAVIAAETLPAVFPLQMTAAGTVRPADVLVVGAGVAGLQAIATARRLGARVTAYDIRPEVREEVESLGADFLDMDVDAETPTTAAGYASAQSTAVYDRQRTALASAVAATDVLITTAAIPGRPAPELITAEAIAAMDDGTVVVDLAADGGGNCEPTQPGAVINHEGVTVIGHTNLPSTVSHTASQLFAANVGAVLTELVLDGLDTSDELVDAILLTHDGTVRRLPREEH